MPHVFYAVVRDIATLSQESWIDSGQSDVELAKSIAWRLASNYDKVFLGERAAEGGPVEPRLVAKCHVGTDAGWVAVGTAILGVAIQMRGGGEPPASLLLALNSIGGDQRREDAFKLMGRTLMTLR